MKKYITLRDRPELKDMAAMWFHSGRAWEQECSDIS